jgi:hypothetical protein
MFILIIFILIIFILIIFILIIFILIIFILIIFILIIKAIFNLEQDKVSDLFLQLKVVAYMWDPYYIY